MPARQPRPTRSQDPEYLAELGGVLLAMTDPQRREFLAGLDRDNLEVAERALAARIAVSWRATPVTMGVHFGALKPWRYSLLLGEKFADAVEGRSIRQIWNLGPQWGKPVCVDEMVSMADGSYRRLGDIKVGDLVVTHLGRSRPVLEVHDQGVIPVRRVVTAGGRSIVAAPDHPFLTADGWLPVDELQPTRPGLPGDVLAVVVPDALGATTRDAVEFRLAGYFIGDGSVTTNTKGSLSCNMTCADPVEAADLYLCAEKMGWTVTVTPRPLPHASRYGFRLVAGGKAEDGPRPWLREAGIAGSTSHTKRVPDWIMTAPAWAVAEFLGAYFACDGSISRAAGRNSGRSIEYYSINRDLLVDVRRLLARLGIYGRLRRKWATSNNFASGPVESWRLGMTGSDSMARFAAQIPVHHSKAERLAEINVRPQSFERRWLPDSVAAIEDAGMAECRCLTVADDSSFVVDDVAVHNSRVGSQWGPAWALDRYPERRFILTSYGDDLANRNSYAVRQILREHRSELHVRLQSDQQRQDRFTTPQGGGILAAGIGSGLTGWGAHGAVIDDPFKNWIDAHSAARRELVYNQYRSVIRMRLTEEWAFLVVIQTRWHENDLTGRLIDAWQDGTGEEFEIVRLPEIAEDPDPTSSNPILRLPDPLGRAPGEILEPERFSAEAVAGRKLAAGSYLWCTPAETPILMADWTELPISEVRAGDQVVGFECVPGHKLKLVITTVSAADCVGKRPVCDYTLASGRVIRATRDHRWFLRAGRPYSPARVGSPLRVLYPNDPRPSDAHMLLWSYLAGIIDGEGHLDRANINIGQTVGKNGPIVKRILQVLDELGLVYNARLEPRPRPQDSDLLSINLNHAGRVLRMLLRYTPFAKRDQAVARLLAGAGGAEGYRDRVLQITEGRPEPVYALETGTGNYVAWGLASANSSLHQQRPAPEEGTEIQRAWFRLEDTLPERFDDSVTTWDPKLKDKEEGDYVVGQCWLRTGSDFWLVDQLRGQWNQATTVNALALMAVRHPTVRRHVVENTGNGPEVMAALRQALPDYVLDLEMAGQLGMTAEERVAVQALRRRGLPGLIASTPKGSKSVRMRAHAPLLEAGNVHINARASWLGAFLDEMAAFPNGAHDDMADCVSLALSRLSHGTASVTSPASAPLPTGGPSVRTGARFGVIPGARVR